MDQWAALGVRNFNAAMAKQPCARCAADKATSAILPAFKTSGFILDSLQRHTCGTQGPTSIPPSNPQVKTPITNLQLGSWGEQSALRGNGTLLSLSENNTMAIQEKFVDTKGGWVFTDLNSTPCKLGYEELVKALGEIATATTARKPFREASLGFVMDALKLLGFLDDAFPRHHAAIITAAKLAEGPSVIRISVYDKELDPRTLICAVVPAGLLGHNGECQKAPGTFTHRYMVAELDDKSAKTVEFGRYNGPNAPGVIKITNSDYHGCAVAHASLTLAPALPWNQFKTLAYSFGYDNTEWTMDHNCQSFADTVTSTLLKTGAASAVPVPK